MPYIVTQFMLSMYDDDDKHIQNQSSELCMRRKRTVLFLDQKHIHI